MLILRTFVRIYIHICIQDKNNIAQIEIKMLSNIYLCNCIQDIFNFNIFYLDVKNSYFKS